MIYYYVYLFIEALIQDEKHILVPTFSDYSHFSPYILFLQLLVSILKNASCFSLYRYIRNGKNWRDKR